MISGLRVKQISRLIARGGYNDALALIESTVDHIFCEPINVALVFGSPELDQFCQSIGRASIEKINGALARCEKNTESDFNTVIYIVSKLQPSGGHTAALNDIIRFSPPSRAIVIVTGTCGRTDKDAIKGKFDRLPNVSIEYVPAGKHLSKLEWIQRRLKGLCPKTVWLFNHHQDSVAIAAVQPDQGYEVRFYHHGDHHLCLGVYLDYAQHFDPHPMGFHNCTKNLGVKNIRYLPLVVEDQGDRPTGMGFLGHRRMVTCTAGGFNKVELPYFIQYVDVVPEILKITGGQHIHIGKLTPFARWRIRRNLSRLGIDKTAFVYLSYVPSVWRALHQFGVDLYVASFPYGGGRTLIEVMGAGVPSTIHMHCTSRMLGGFDMAYEEALIWRRPDELFEFLKKADSYFFEKEGRCARAWYEKYHHETVMKNALCNFAQIDAPSLRPDYKPDALMQAIQNCSEVTLRGLLTRFAYRKIRLFKSILGRVF